MGSHRDSFLCGHRAGDATWEGVPLSISQTVTRMPECKVRLKYTTHRAGMLCDRCKVWASEEVDRMRRENETTKEDYKILEDALRFTEMTEVERCDPDTFLCGQRICGSHLPGRDKRPLSHIVPHMPECKVRLKRRKYRTGMLCDHCFKWVSEEVGRMQKENRTDTPDYKFLEAALRFQEGKKEELPPIEEKELSEKEKSMPTLLLPKICSRIVKPDGKLLSGWRAASGKRPPTLSDFKLPGEEWKACSKTLQAAGGVCNMCIAAIENALRTSDRLTPETRPYFEATLERHRSRQQSQRTWSATSRKRLAERMESSPETVEHIKRIRLAFNQRRASRRRADKAAVLGGDPTIVAKASRKNTPYCDMVLAMDADSLQNSGRSRQDCHWDSNDKFLVHHTPWEFLGVYVTDGSGNFESGRVSLGMYFPAIRVVRAFALQLYEWEKLACGNRSVDRFKLRPLIKFGTYQSDVKPHPNVTSGTKSCSMSVDDSGVEFDFTLGTTGIDEHLRTWEVIGSQLLAFAAESRAILDKKLSGVEVRRKADGFYLLDVDTAKRLVVSHFKDTQWLQRTMLRLIDVDIETESTKDTEIISCIALRSGQVGGLVYTEGRTPWLGCLTDLNFGSSHRPSQMRLQEFKRFFTVIREGVSAFGTPWAALAARRFLFGAISGDGHVSQPDAREHRIELVINHNPWLTELHVILFRLAFGVTPHVRLHKNTVVPDDGRKDVVRKTELLYCARNDVITVARQFDRPGINNDFMSPLKRGKLTFIANMLKIRADKEDRSGRRDKTEEEAVRDDKRRWTEELLRVDEVINGSPVVSATEDEVTVPEADTDVDWDADSDADAWYDSDTEILSES